MHLFPPEVKPEEEVYQLRNELGLLSYRFAASDADEGPLLRIVYGPHELSLTLRYLQHLNKVLPRMLVVGGPLVQTDRLFLEALKELEYQMIQEVTEFEGAQDLPF